MSDLDFSRWMRDLENRLTRLESLGLPFTTNSDGTMTAVGLNVNTTGAAAGQIYLPGSNSMPSILAGGAVVQSRDADTTLLTSNLYFNGSGWKHIANGYGSAIQLTDGTVYITTATNNTGGAGASASLTNNALFDNSGNTTIYGGLNVGSATGAAAGAINLAEISAPSNPGANIGTIFMQDNGAGKTQLCVRFNTGAAIVLATQA